VLAPLLHGNNGRPMFPPLAPLAGVRAEGAGVLLAIPAAIFTALMFFFLLFILRLLLRRERIAGAAFVLILAAATGLTTITPAVDFSLHAVIFGMFAFALLRYGLLATIVASACGEILVLGASFDFSAWYAGMAAIPYALVLLIAVYGFRTSLGGRPLLNLEP
jgi:hypothetical protein